MEKQYEEFLKLIHAFKRTTSKVKTNSLAPAEFMTLIAIQHIGMSKQKNGIDEGVKVSDISEQLETSKPDVSKKIRLLEQKELVKRCENKQDKRVTYIEITDKGNDILLANWRKAEEFLTNVLKRMGEADMMEFMRLCERMREAMEEEIKELQKGKDMYEENP